jgi:hypothetical protein
MKNKNTATCVMTCFPGYRISIPPGKSCELLGDAFALCETEVNVRAFAYMLSLGRVELSYAVDDLFEVRKGGKILHADDQVRSKIADIKAEADKLDDDIKTLKEVSEGSKEQTDGDGVKEGETNAEEQTQAKAESEEGKEENKATEPLMSEEAKADENKPEEAKADENKPDDKLAEAKIVDKPKAGKKVQVK